MMGNVKSPLKTPFHTSPTVLPSRLSMRGALPPGATTASPAGLNTSNLSMRVSCTLLWAHCVNRRCNLLRGQIQLFHELRPLFHVRHDEARKLGRRAADGV